MDEDLPLIHKFESPQPTKHQPEKKKPKKKFFAWLWGFIKKNKIAELTALVIVVITVVVYIVLPVVTIGQYSFVNENTLTRIELGQTARLKYSNVSVKINRFISNVCPSGQKCFGSGPVVDYDFTIDGQKYVDTSLTPNVSAYKYQVKTVKTDNKTYAEIKIVKS